MQSTSLPLITEGESMNHDPGRGLEVCYLVSGTVPRFPANSLWVYTFPPITDLAW